MELKNKIIAIVLVSILIVGNISIIWFISNLIVSESEDSYSQGYFDGITARYGGEPDSQYNFQVMRDLFTSMYNDSVTVENAGYVSGNYNVYNYSVIKEGGWTFWVNHTRVLDSYYFNNSMCYLVKIPLDGRIEILENG